MKLYIQIYMDQKDRKIIKTDNSKDNFNNKKTIGRCLCQSLSNIPMYKIQSLAGLR